MSERLEDIAAAMVSGGKGLLAADESSGTIKKRFDVIGVESTADNRRDYREMMFRAREAMSKYISGVILYDETIRQKAADGTPLVDIIKASGAIPGIKVDLGAKPLAGFPGDTITEGLDGLRERLADYYKLGARFAKWRAVIDIDTAAGVPSGASIASNMHALARYAALCQEAGIVPIVEPEVMMEGDHGIGDGCGGGAIGCYDFHRTSRGAIGAPEAGYGVGSDDGVEAGVAELHEVMRVAIVGGGAVVA